MNMKMSGFPWQPATLYVTCVRVWLRVSGRKGGTAPMHVTCDVTICHGNLDASMLSCACHSRRRPSMNFYPSSCLPSPLCLAWPHPCRTLQIDIVPFSSNRLLIPKQTPLDLSLDMPVILCHTVSAYSIYI